MCTRDRDIEITKEIVQRYLNLHSTDVAKLDKLDRYYRGKHDILHRSKENDLANNRLVCNHAKHITDTAVGYLVGNPVTYKSDLDLDALLDWAKRADVDTEDMDIAKDASVFGRAYELVYMSDDENPSPRVTVIDPRNAFAVYDDTVEHSPVFGVYYYPVYGPYNTIEKYKGQYIRRDKIVAFTATSSRAIEREEAPFTNPFGMVTLIEYSNNEEQQGDFEQVISLIDAYNILQSDRVNDKQQFVEAILLIKGQTLGDDADEESEAYRNLRKYGLLMLDKDSSAEWLTRTFDESSVEILRSSIEQDIHKFTGIPCMTDDNFAGNTSGVAMKYKLLGFEQVTKIKERYMRDGLKYRLRLFCAMLGIKGMPAVDPEQIEIVFTRALPANELELAQVVATLQGMVPDATLLSLLPFVGDAQQAADELQAQKEESVRLQQQAFAATANTPPEDVSEDDEE
ncbi:phage portal protein [Akkermansia muciniphila]|uniref:phage portal protein n=1 Tax=Akkermansia muciniphila TaxID=239935 RepID=UPI00122F6315|nr:phage portal protein [Akkermansia muciniphila]